MTSSTSAPSTARPALPQHLRSSPWLVFARPAMDYFSLPLHPTTYFASPEADEQDGDVHSPLSSDASTSTTSSQRSFYDNSFNYLNYRSGLELPSPSFALEDNETETQFIEDVNDELLLSPSSTVSSSLTLADHLADQSSFSPSLHTHSSSSSFSSSGQHEHGFPITPPNKTFTLTLPPSRRLNNKAQPQPQPHLMEFRSLSGTPSRPPKKEEVHVDTPFPTEEELEEEEDEHRGRGLERRGGWLGNGFELRLGGEGIAGRRS